MKIKENEFLAKLRVINSDTIQITFIGQFVNMRSTKNVFEFSKVWYNSVFKENYYIYYCYLNDMKNPNYNRISYTDYYNLCYKLMEAEQFYQRVE